MAYSEKLLQRIRKLLADRQDVVEKKMFGGVVFMVDGNMAGGPFGDSLIARIGNEAADEAMKKRHVKPLEFSGMVMKTFVEIEPDGIKPARQLRYWVEMAATYAASLPPGKKKKRQRRMPMIISSRRRRAVE